MPVSKTRQLSFITAYAEWVKISAANAALGVTAKILSSNVLISNYKSLCITYDQRLTKDVSSNV